MKQIFKTNLGIKVKDVAVPLPGDNEIQVQVFNSLISVGTEVGSMKAKTWAQKYEGAKTKVEKLLNLIKQEGVKYAYGKIVSKFAKANIESDYTPIGYSNSGVIISKGKNVTNFNVGDRVACGGNSFAVHGEVAIIPKNLAVKLPENITFHEAAFTTIGSIAMQGLRRSDAKPGEWVIIYGVGLLGLIAVQIARSWGLHVIAIDINDDKLALAKNSGAEVIINTTKEQNIGQIVMSNTNGFGADASIIYASTSSSEPVNNSFSLCRLKANIVIVGAVGMDLKREDFYMKEQNLIISTSYGPGRYDLAYESKGHDYPIGYVRWTENRNMMEFVSLLNSKQVNISFLLTSIKEVDEAVEIYQKLASPLNDEIGVLFNFNPKTEEEAAVDFVSKINLNSRPVLKDQINVGIIGAGGYVKDYILPFVNNNKDFNLIGLCNKTSQSSLEVGKAYNFNYITGDFHEILKDDKIDLVIIGTRHDLHSELTLRALKAKKHVFVEKPLSLNLEGIDKIQNELATSGTKLFLGFNRRYSSLSQELLSKIYPRKNPIMINFRINAGKIPANSWIQDPEIGGGRIIGEACHFIDLCSYLVGEEVISIDINSIPKDNKIVFADDNFVITINYKDGSLANIFYTALGGSNQPKELLEVYHNGNSYIIDDFLEFSEYSKSGSNKKRLKEQDKGRKFQIEEIVKCLKGKTSLIPDTSLDINASILAVYAQEKLYGKS